MKRRYQKPGMNVVHIQHQCLICQSVTDADTNVGIKFRGAGNGESRVKGQGDDDWYDDWED